MTTTIEERVSRLEGGYEHLATKADLAELKASIAELKVELIKWMVGLMVGSVAVASSIALFVQRLIG
jgi:hypothetical protein